MSIQVRSPRRHERARQVSLGSLFPLLLIAGVALAATATPTQTLGAEFGGVSTKLTREQKKLITRFEKALTTPFNSQDKNPDDKHTWYVIVFTDTALGRRQSRFALGDELIIARELQAAGQRAAKMAHGRKDAVLLLLQYYSAPNAAAAKLKPTVGGTTDWATADAAKNWEYMAFAKEAEAKAFFDRVNPERQP